MQLALSSELLLIENSSSPSDKSESRLHSKHCGIIRIAARQHFFFSKKTTTKNPHLLVSCIINAPMSPAVVWIFLSCLTRAAVHPYLMAQMTVGMSCQCGFPPTLFNIQLSFSVKPLCDYICLLKALYKYTDLPFFFFLTGFSLKSLSYRQWARRSLKGFWSELEEIICNL